jgi:hypothetical protein
VHLHDGTTNNPSKFKECTQSVCIIDDVTLNILAGSVVGDISFSQACSSCSSNTGTSSCRCYITDTTVTAIDSLLGNISFKQQCGNTPLCYKKAPVLGAPPIQVDCDTGAEVKSSGNSTGASGTTVRTLWIVFGILIGLVVIIILFATSRPAEVSPPVYIPGEPPVQSRPFIASSKSEKSRPMLKRK